MNDLHFGDCLEVLRPATRSRPIKRSSAQLHNPSHHRTEEQPGFFAKAIAPPVCLIVSTAKCLYSIIYLYSII